MSTKDTRLQQLKHWLSGHLNEKGLLLRPASEDASFRRYFRVWSQGRTYIAMDAPPEQEDSEPFIRIGRRLRQHGLNVPEILEHDLAQGFLLIGDLGNTSYLSRLDAGSADRLYADALRALLRMQTEVPGEDLPAYDDDWLRREMSFFIDWFLIRHLKLKPDSRSEQRINHTFEQLLDSAREQPRVFVHRDYHSRNLMVTPDNNPGILDFQGAVYGPIGYDLVSLFRDCYIAWPRNKVQQWLETYYRQLTDAGLIDDVPLPRFQRWFDWIGLQRHLKVTGLFCRLYYTQNKAAYLHDLPRTLEYIYDVCGRYEELLEFQSLLKRLSIRERLSA